MEYNNQLSENDKRFADEFSNYVNGKMASPRKVGKALADDHRYLVNEKAKLMVYFMEQLAENWHKGRYDQRNEWACRLAAEAIADKFGNNAIADTYRRAKSEWKDNYKYWTELCLVLNHKIWQWHERDNQRAILYDKLWREADAMTAEWSNEEQEYYFEITD